ncbi:hypothetical protein [Oceanobacillus rekensis]|uniref:hypothetical protein n=1 Tax=Oceanobacillus rekensis TaxID=937927 RepID=UPI000B4430B3|nr:hypothetical protein [Oceanobacillus rekensis]
MRRNEEHQEIIDGLQNMPKIKDNTDKNMLYNRISLEMSNTRVIENRFRKKKLVPILVTILTALIIVLVPFMLKTEDQVKQNDKQFSEIEMETNFDRNEESIVMENSDRDQESGEAATNYSEEVNEIKINMEDSLNSFIIQGSSTSKIVYGAIPDLGKQYIIPVSFIVDQDASVEEYYNELENYIKNVDVEWATNDYMLANASFQLKESDVIIDLGDNFSIGAGSTNAYIFEQMLATMFTPYGINKAVFESKHHGVELGPFGVIEELSLSKEDDSIYKLYNNQFLIPIPNSNLSIHDAMSEMKMEQEGFNISQTVPDEVQLSVESSDELLLLTLEEESTIGHDQEVMTMIEAILMTAKSYGYQSVQFRNFPVNQIGPYDITKPIPVPKAVNPVDIRN